MVPQTFYTVKHKLFPSFEPKRYHLQLRHAALAGLLLIAASIALPAYHQTMNFAESLDYDDSPDLPVKSSFDSIHRYANQILYFNEAIALWMIVCLLLEAIFQRSVPVWFEFAWMLLVIAGEIVCLVLMVSSRPVACDYNFGVDNWIPTNAKLSPMNSITSLCSNYRGIVGMLGALIVFFTLHLVWHLIIALRYMRSRPGYFTTPIPEYRWTLPRALERLEPQIPPTDIEKAATKEKQLESESAEYTSRGTETLSFPMTPTSEEYSNFSRLPANSKPVVLVQSSVTKSDTSSIVEEVDGSPKVHAPFSYDSK